MHQRAYEGQCTAEERRHTSAKSAISEPKSTLFALALGTFAIGTGEFGSNGIIQLFASDLDVSIPVAAYAITAYAVGVMVGSPAITLLAARINRRTLLLGHHCRRVARPVAGRLGWGVPEQGERAQAARGRETAAAHPPPTSIQALHRPPSLEQTAHRRSPSNTECDAKIARYRAVLDAGGDPALVTTWITQTQAERLRAQTELDRHTGSAHTTEK
ncbi:hypothetical protein Raf01_86970 [Rugosimonospora africana]|uniref:MFS transporter n=1 Tax=Rugosimonospora africana TaxID=556532 RepID=A0A8J3R362_9ACTN|nr:hypothetical protein Raf01_86970 [Rugosimonospora africana]